MSGNVAVFYLLKSPCSVMARPLGNLPESETDYINIFFKSKSLITYGFCVIFWPDDHYSDVMMSTMAFQITGVSSVWSTICSVADWRFASLVFVTGTTGHRWIPPQRANNAENVSIWWRHHDVIQNGRQDLAKYCVTSSADTISSHRDGRRYYIFEKGALFSHIQYALDCKTQSIVFLSSMFTPITCQQNMWQTVDFDTRMRITYMCVSASLVTRAELKSRTYLLWVSRWLTG